MARILVISHTPTHPVNSGNRARVNSLLSSLQAAGHEICLYFLDFGNGDNRSMENTWDRFQSLPYTFPRPTMGRRVRNLVSKICKIECYKPYQLDDWYRKDLDAKLHELKEASNFDVVLVEYVFFSRAFESFPQALKILDTHDIFGDRHKLFLKHGKQPSWFYTTPEEERIGLQRADAVLAIQEQEKNYFSSLAPGTKVLTVGHVTRIAPPCPAKPFFNRLLFIGSGNDVNMDALAYFLEEIWPEIRRRSPGTQLDVVGNICNRLDRLPEGCHARGEVNDIGVWYAKVDLVINPVRFGTGLKIKNIEAMGYGMPLVTTQVGAEGLEEGLGTAFLAATSMEEFVRQICRLLADGLFRTSLAAAAFQFARAYNDQATKPLMEFIDREVLARQSLL